MSCSTIPGSPRADAPAQRRVTGTCHYNLSKANDIADASLVSPLADYPSARQKWIRRRTRHLSLPKAVGCAVDAIFRFTHRALKARALWSEAERVWLGRETFLHWALSDAEIDIPWVVADSIGAPIAFDALHAAVNVELAAYWERRLATLPRTGNPCWLPLP
jgi:hypothetical protein